MARSGRESSGLDGRVVAVLAELAESGRAAAAGAVAEEVASCPAISEAALSEVRGLLSSQTVPMEVLAEETVWQALIAAGVPTSNVARALQAALDSSNKTRKALAAALYAALLCTQGCPVFSLFDDFAFGKVLKLVKDTLCIGGKAQTSHRGRPADVGEEYSEDEANEDTMEDDLENCASASKILEWSIGILSDVGYFLKVVVLREMPDAKRSIAQMLVDIFAGAFGATQVQVMDSCTMALAQLLQPHHGSIQESAVLVMRLLAPGLWSNDSLLRRKTLGFMSLALKESPDTTYASAAAARYALLHAPDKADFRTIVVASVSELASEIPKHERELLVWFIARLSLAAKANQRQLAVQAASSLLEAEGIFGFGWLAGGGAETGAQMTTPIARAQTAPLGLVGLAVLVQRCCDKQALVRAKALQGVVSAIEMLKKHSTPDIALKVLAMSTDFPVGACLASQLLPPQPGLAGQEGQSQTPAQTTPGPTVPGSALSRRTPNSMDTGDVPSPQQMPAHIARPSQVGMPLWTQQEPTDQDSKIMAMVGMVHRRVVDEKAPVRKQAVLLLEALLFLRAENGHLPDQDDIDAVEAATSDPLVSVRRSGLGVASHMLARFPLSVQVASMWVQTALPLIRDAEQGLQETTLEEFSTLVLHRCSAAAEVDRRTGEPTAAAVKAVTSLRPILTAMSSGGALVSSSLGRAVQMASAKRMLKASAVCGGLQTLLSFTSEASEDGSARHEASGAWRLLIEVSHQDPSGPSWEFLRSRWEAMSRADAGGSSGSGEQQASLLRVIANAAARFPTEEAGRLAGDLVTALMSFRLSPTAASAHVQAMAKLSQDDKACISWTKQILRAAEAELGQYTSPIGRDDQERVGPEESAGNGGSKLFPQDFRAVTALFTTGELALLGKAKLPDRLVVIIQALTAPHVVAEAAAAVEPGPVSLAGHVTLPGPVQAHTWTALGKMCLADKALAKKCLPLFVQELGRAELAAVRNNIVIALSDMCVHFTALVDAHIPRIAACIRDPCELVRRQTLAVLVHLLQKDFVKWRGVLFHRFLLSLVDPSPAVVQLGEYLLATVLGPKASLLLYNHFVEAMFVLNNCKAGMYGAAISAVSAGPTELNVDGLFSLEGSSLATVAKRRSIYKVNKPDSFLSDSISALDTYPDRTIVSRGLGLLLLSSWAAALETT